jgi:hypothetical protein
MRGLRDLPSRRLNRNSRSRSVSIFRVLKSYRQDEEYILDVEELPLIVYRVVFVLVMHMVVAALDWHY